MAGIDAGEVQGLINCIVTTQEDIMQDYKVYSILNKTKRMITSGKSPVDYIDGVLDTIQDGQPTVETVAPQKKPLLAADYGNGAKALF
jgi:hypothetical protein